MNKPNVLLFDIDNTLLDFSAGAMQAMEEIFRAAGLPYAPGRCSPCFRWRTTSSGRGSSAAS